MCVLGLVDIEHCDHMCVGVGGIIEYCGRVCGCCK